MFRRVAKLVVFSVLALIVASVAGALTFAIIFYLRVTRDLPQIETLADYRPKAVTSLYASGGELIAEIYDERRYPVAFESIPPLVRNAFLAAEDANFYHHPGIDLISILRALWVNVRSQAARQGASTITQQIVKSLVLSNEKTLERKVKEAILSYRLEKHLSKDEIFAIYLNEIYLGSGAYGVRAAARVHFHKELGDLTIAEASYLAGLPKKPTELSRLENRPAAVIRQRYVIREMEENGYIAPAEARAALEQPLSIYMPDEQNIFAVPYFAAHSIKVLRDVFAELKLPGTPTDPGGLEIHTTVDVRASGMAEAALHRGLQELDRRQGWRGPILKEDAARMILPSDQEPLPGRIYAAAVTSVEKEQAQVQLGARRGVVNLAEARWARRLVHDGTAVTVSPAKVLKKGDYIEVKVEPGEEEGGLPKLELAQTPEVEGAVVIINPLTGEVVSLIGGYDYQRNVFNRATQALRQPGSAFKPFIYLAALEKLQYSPVTIVPDEPVSLVAGNGKLWSPGNYDNKFLGPITLRTALQRSRNVVSVHLIQKVGLERVIETARRMGIQTPIQPNFSISLGTAEVRMLELVQAYGAFGTGGYLAAPLVIRSIKNRQGVEIYKQDPKQERVIDERVAFVMANMMKGVVERGTAQGLRKLERPIAGKTGTTNEQMDAWFIGYTPDWVGGVWVGYDLKRSIGEKETGGRAAAPIFLYMMEQFLADKPPLDFFLPDGVIPIPIDLRSGHVVSEQDPDAFWEYFMTGTEPHAIPDDTGAAEEAAAEAADYLSSEDF